MRRRFSSCESAARSSERPSPAVALSAGVWTAILAVGQGLAQPFVTPDSLRSTTAAVRRAPLTAADAQQVGACAAAVFRGEVAPWESLPEAFGEPPAVVYLAARANGERLAAVWSDGATGTEALSRGLGVVRSQLGPVRSARVTALEVNLAYDFRPLDPWREPERMSNVYRGLRGIQVVTNGAVLRFGPTEMIALNLGFERALERLYERAGSAPLAAEGGAAQFSLFEADQLLVDLTSDPARTTVLYRGNTLVPVEAVTRDAVERLRQALAGWMAANLQPDGRMVYLYWPSRGEESTGNNEIRQWMATVALIREAQSRQDTNLLDRAEQNIRFNLARSFRTDANGHGQIVEGQGVVKLGAVALACLALVEHPNRARFAEQEAALRKTVDALWSPSGEFRTFWSPTNRTDNVNFYPGEALLLWATLFEQSRDADLRRRIEASLRFYRTWHRANRNPAFVPWHTQAYFKLWSVTRSVEVQDWIFEMNDWLLGVQQWEEQRAFPDTMGRFYDPDRPFGPPHASSTGVYLEGLIDAWRLAREAGDAGRQERYRQAIIRGLRSVTQLAFLDEADLFYVSKRDRARGGVRTTVYDNAIRVDNVQHNLMAIQKILAYLPGSDFRP